MTDIVERLRNVAKGIGHRTIQTVDDNHNFVSLDEFLREAADTIERCYGAIADLQAEVRRKSEEIERLQKLTHCDSCGKPFDENGGICEPCNAASVAGNIKSLKAEIERLNAKPAA